MPFPSPESLPFLIDQLSNCMENFGLTDWIEFMVATEVLTATDAKTVYRAYLDLAPEERLTFDNEEWLAWLEDVLS